MSLLEQLQADMKQAMRSGEKLKVDVLRMAIAAVKNAQMAHVKAAFDAAGGEAAGELAQQAAAQAGQISDQAMLDVVGKEVKRRREAVEAYQKANRADLAAQEEAEAAILGHYLPRQMTADELRPLVLATLAELGLTSPADMNKAMPALMAKFKGQADGKVISQLAREALQK